MALAKGALRLRERAREALECACVLMAVGERGRERDENVRVQRRLGLRRLEQQTLGVRGVTRGRRKMPSLQVGRSEVGRCACELSRVVPARELRERETVLPQLDGFLQARRAPG